MSLRTARKLLFLLMMAIAGAGYFAYNGGIALPALSLTGWLIPCALWIIVITAMFMWDVSDEKDPMDKSAWKPNRIMELIRNA